VIFKLHVPSKVGYGTRSVLSPPFSRVEPAEEGGDDVGCPLDNVEVTPSDGGDTLLPTKTELVLVRMSWLWKYMISKLKITSTTKVRTVIIPIKGR
jgi:hypothetical protein